METLDQDVVNLSKAIRQHESGGDFKIKGKSGESGGYQFMPDTWKGYAKDILGDEKAEMTPQNQNKVAYTKIKKWKDSGKNVGQIASMWNAGEGKPNAYKENWRGTNSQGVKYDTPAYAKAVAGYYQEYKGSSQSNLPQGSTTGNPTTQNSPNQNNPNQSNPNQRKPFTEFMKDTANNPNADLKAGNPTVSSKTGKVGEVAAGLIPGNKLAQATGYSLSNAMGSQKGLIEAQDRGIDIQGQLLKQIKDNKAKGRNTSRLEKALSQLTNDIQTQGSQVEDVGTGGITNKQVLKSAGSLAVLPATAYGSTVLGGGGVMGTSRGLTSGVLGKSANAVEPAIKAAINSSDKLGFSDILNKGLNLKDSVNLSNFEKFTRLAANDKASIIRNIISKNPELVQSVKKGILPEVLNKLKWIGGTLVLDRVFGGKVGGVIKGLF